MENSNPHELLMDYLEFPNLNLLSNFDLALYSKLHQAPFNSNQHFFDKDSISAKLLIESVCLALCNYKSDYVALLSLAPPLKAGPLDPFTSHSSDKNDLDLPPEYRKHRRGKPCGHVFTKGEGVYRCRFSFHENCAKDDTCVLCSHCFFETDHEGHETSFSMSNMGGSCDCEDPEAWKVKLNCKYHSISPNEQTEVKKHPLPADLKESFKKTIATVLDFIIDTVDFALPLEKFMPQSEKDIREIDSFETGSEMEKFKNGKLLYALILWNDDSHMINESSMSFSQAKAEEIVRSIDEYGRGILEVSSDVASLVNKAEKMCRVKLSLTIRTARETYREHLAEYLLDWLKDLSKNVGGEKKMNGIMFEDIDTVLNQIIFEELHSERRNIKYLFSQMLPNRSAISHDIVDVNHYVESDHSRLRVDYFLVSEYKLWKSMRNHIKTLLVNSVLILGEHAKKTLASRFVKYYPHITYALLKDRENELSISLYKCQIFTAPSVADYMLQNTSVISKIFTILKAVSLSDSNSAFNLNKFFESYELAKEMKAYYGKLKCVSDTFDNTKKYRQSFSDLQYILSVCRKELVRSHPSMLSEFLDLAVVWQGMHQQQRHSTTHVEFESMVWVGVFKLSNSIVIISDMFTNCFRPSPQIEPGSQLAMDNLNSLISALQLTMEKIYTWNDLSALEEIPNSNHERFRVAVNGVSFHNPLHWILSGLLSHLPKSLKLVDGKKSIYGSLFWDSFLPKDFTNLDSIPDVNDGLRLVLPGGFDTSSAYDSRFVVSTTSSKSNGTNHNNRFIYILEHSLRVIVLMAQIRANIWVRNGIMIRSQALYYRSVGVDHDVFLLQVGAVAVGSKDLYLQTLLERFDMTKWFHGRIKEAQTSTGFENSQMVQLGEDLLQLLIVVLSERSRAAAVDIHHEMKMEIIHTLAVKPSGISFSVLTSKIPRKLTEWTPEEGVLDKRLITDVLLEVATFRQPDGVSDQGLYELKDEFFDFVDPWFWHYSRNDRQEVEEVLRSRNLKKNSEKKKMIERLDVWAPNLHILELGSGFESLGDIVHTEVFVELLFFSLWNTSKSVLTPKRVRTTTKTRIQQSQFVQEDELSLGVRGDTLFAEAVQLVIIALEIQKNEIVSGWSTARKELNEKIETTEKLFVNIAANHAILLNRRIPSSILAELQSTASFTDSIGDIITFEINESDVSQRYVNCEMTLIDLILELADHETDEFVKEQALRIKWIIQEFENIGDETGKAICAEWRQSLESEKQNAIPMETDATISEAERKKLAAKQRKAAIIAQMAAQRNSFMTNHTEDETPIKVISKDDNDKQDIKTENWKYPFGTCIFCQEQADSEMYGMLVLVQKSQLVRYMDMKTPSSIVAAISSPLSLDINVDRKSVSQFGHTVAGEKLQTKAGIHASSCGHLMHMKCFVTYKASINIRHSSQPNRLQPETLKLKEFLCPLCKSLGNCLLPVVWNGVDEQIRNVNSYPLECETFWNLGIWWNKRWSVKLAQQQTRRAWVDGLLVMKSFEENESINFTSFDELSKVDHMDIDENDIKSTLPHSRPKSVNPIAFLNQLFDEFDLSLSQSHFSSITCNSRELSECYKDLLDGVLQVVSEERQNDIVERLWDTFGYTIECLEIASRGQSSNFGATTENYSQIGILGSLSTQSITLLRVLSRTILTYTSLRLPKEGKTNTSKARFADFIRKCKSDTLISVFQGFLELSQITTRSLELASKRLQQNEFFNENEEKEIIDLLGSQFDGLQVFSSEKDTFLQLAECSLTFFPSLPFEESPIDAIDDIFSWVGVFYVLEIVKVSVAMIEGIISGSQSYSDEKVFEASYNAAQKMGISKDDETSTNRRDAKGKKPVRGSEDEQMIDAIIPPFFSGRSMTYNSKEERNALHFMNWIMVLLCISPSTRLSVLARINPRVLLTLTRAMLLPFLRKAVILLHARCHMTPSPSELGDEDEFTRLTKYLRIPAIANILSTQTISNSFLARLIAGWCLSAVQRLQISQLHKVMFQSDEDLTADLAESITEVMIVAPEDEDSAPMINYLPSDLQVPRLISSVNPWVYIASQPDKYQPLFSFHSPLIYELVRLPHRMVYLFSAKKFIAVPTLKEWVNAIRTQMSKLCSGNIGIFFDYQRCVLLYLHNNTKGTFATAPYLDSHGETDTEFRRRHPMFLNQRRYEEVRKQWLTHMVPSIVARKVEASMNVGGWRTM
ncbi:hypothetical protein HK096_002677 [Nowakowskiella sp. JEL0078]|nr:hypothetical protein HK096_002677 [Nowakowskiella sp. JEL0078]